VAAFFGGNGDQHSAFWAIFLGRIGGRRGLLQTIDALDHQKDAEGDDQKIHNIVDKESVMDRNRFGIADRDLQIKDPIAEINAADEQADGRHQDITDQRRHDLSEGCADNHADGQINDISAHDKGFKFFKHWVPLVTRYS